MSNTEGDSPVPRGRKRKSSYRFTKTNEYSKVVLKVQQFLKELNETLVSFRHLSHLSTLFQGLNVNEKTASLCNVSPATVCRVLRRAKGLDPPIIKKPKAPTRKYECDDFTISMIRRVTQQFYSQKTFPTAQKILAKCQENPEFPPIHLSRFKTWLKEKCKFKYKKVNKKPVYLEKNTIVLQREEYLRKIKFYRENNYKIYYSDETWASPDQTRNNCWQFLLTNEEYRELNDILAGPVLRDMNGYAGTSYFHIYN